MNVKINAKYSELSMTNSQMVAKVRSGEMTEAEYITWYEAEFYPAIINFGKAVMQDQVDNMTDKEFQSFRQLLK